MARSGRSGFTLIELLLTTTLLVLAVTFVAVNVEGVIPEYRLEGAAREIGATAAEVQSEATLSGRIHGIVYDLDADEYWILAPPEEEEDGDAPAAAPEDGDRLDAHRREMSELVPLPASRFRRGIKFVNVSLGGKRTRSSGAVRILFEPDGSGPPHSVHIADEDGKEYTIEMNPFAGTVEFYQGKREFDVFLEGEE